MAGMTRYTWFQDPSQMGAGPPQQGLPAGQLAQMAQMPIQGRPPVDPTPGLPIGWPRLAPTPGSTRDVLTRLFPSLG
jgi:hypothetical protein